MAISSNYKTVTAQETYAVARQLLTAGAPQVSIEAAIDMFVKNEHNGFTPEFRVKALEMVSPSSSSAITIISTSKINYNAPLANELLAFANKCIAEYRTSDFFKERAAKEASKAAAKKDAPANTEEPKDKEVSTKKDISAEDEKKSEGSSSEDVGVVRKTPPVVIPPAKKEAAQPKIEAAQPDDMDAIMRQIEEYEMRAAMKSAEDDEKKRPSTTSANTSSSSRPSSSSSSSSVSLSNQANSSAGSSKPVSKPAYRDFSADFDFSDNDQDFSMLNLRFGSANNSSSSSNTNYSNYSDASDEQEEIMNPEHTAAIDLMSMRLGQGGREAEGVALFTAILSKISEYSPKEVIKIAKELYSARSLLMYDLKEAVSKLGMKYYPAMSKIDSFMSDKTTYKI